MTEPVTTSIWRIPLVREIGVILAFKLIILFVIKFIWFSHPALPDSGNQPIDQHFFDNSNAQSMPLTMPPTEENRG